MEKLKVFYYEELSSLISIFSEKSENPKMISAQKAADNFSRTSSSLCESLDRHTRALEEHSDLIREQLNREIK